MTVYNGEIYLRDVVESTLNQTFKEFEFIIVDDGSTDSTADILQFPQGPRIKIIEQSNQECARARQKAIEFASGEYIAIMDADDLAHKERLMKTVRYLDSVIGDLVGYLFFGVRGSNALSQIGPGNPGYVLLRNSLAGRGIRSGILSIFFKHIENLYRAQLREKWKH